MSMKLGLITKSLLEEMFKEAALEPWESYQSWAIKSQTSTPSLLSSSGHSDFCNPDPIDLK